LTAIDWIADGGLVCRGDPMIDLLPTANSLLPTDSAGFRLGRKTSPPNNQRPSRQVRSSSGRTFSVRHTPHKR